MVTLQLFKAKGKAPEVKSLESMDEVYPHLRLDLPIELRYGFSALASGVRVIPTKEAIQLGIIPLTKGEYCLIFSNGHVREIDPGSVWKVSQIRYELHELIELKGAEEVG